MSEYKLVPFEPTNEMGIAGCEAVSEMPNNTWLDHDEAVACFKAMLAAAPDVQGEPVGWVWHSYNQTNFTSGSHHKEVLEADGVKLTPVYTAPQPAPDVAGLVEALEAIAESCDVGRHDGLPEEGSALCATEAWLIAKDALTAYRKQETTK